MRCAVVLLVCGCGRFGFDGGSAPDALPDAVPDAPSFCALNTDAMFCSDLSMLDPWTNGNIHNATYEVQGGTLHATSVPVLVGDSGEAYVNYTLSTAGTRVTASMDVRVDQAGAGEPIFMQLRMTTPTSIHGVEYVYRAPPSQAYVEEFRDARDTSPVLYDSTLIPGPPFPTGEWHRIELTIDVTTVAHTVVFQDGVQVLDAPLIGTAGGGGRVGIGLVYVMGPADAWDLRLDNVLATAQ